MSYITDILITINREDYKRAKKKFKAGKVFYIPGVGIETDKFSRGNVDIEKKRRELVLLEKISCFFQSVNCVNEKIMRL